MNSIDNIFAKRQMIEDLRVKQLQIPISNEAEHATIFNRIWRLNNEIKALENAVNNGINYAVEPTRHPGFDNQTSNNKEDDMGDDFTIIPVEPAILLQTQPLIINQNQNQNQNQNIAQVLPPDNMLRKINGILFTIEMLEKMPKTRETQNEIENLQSLLSKLV